MAYSPLTKLPQQFFDNLGDPLSGGTLESYVAGTTTPTNMFSDDAGTVAGTSVTLDSRGEPTTIKQIWLDETVTYKFILKDSSGSTIWTVDDVPADPSQGVAASITIADAGGYYTGTTVEAALQEAAVYTQDGTGAITRTVDARLKEVASALDYGVTGDGDANDATNFAFANTAVSTRGKTILVPGGKTIRLSSNTSLSAGNVLLMGPDSKFSRDSGVSLTNSGVILSAGGFDTGLVGTDAQVARGFYATTNSVTGASTSSEVLGVIHHGFNVSGDNLDVETNSTFKFATAVDTSLTAGGSSMNGGRIAMRSTFLLNAASSSGSTVRNYTGFSGTASASSDDNGTSGSKAGKLVGVEGAAYALSGADHFDTLVGVKATANAFTSTAPGKRYGVLVENSNVFALNGDRGVNVDAMIGLTDINSTSTGTWSTGILFGDMSGQHPVAAAGTLIKTSGSGTVTDGIDLSSYTFTGAAIKSSGREKFISATGFDMTSSTSPDSAVLTIGDADTTGYIYLLSNTANEYDSRIFTTAGTSGDGNGTMTLDSQTLQISAAVLLQLSEIDDYADDAAAATGGVSVGQVYRTGSTLKVRVS